MLIDENEIVVFLADATLVKVNLAIVARPVGLKRVERWIMLGDVFGLPIAWHDQFFLPVSAVWRLFLKYGKRKDGMLDLKILIAGKEIDKDDEILLGRAQFCVRQVPDFLPLFVLLDKKSLFETSLSHFADGNFAILFRLADGERVDAYNGEIRFSSLTGIVN